MTWRCALASLVASCSKKYFSNTQAETEKSSIQSKSVNAAPAISFPPSDLTRNCMQSLQNRIKVRGGRGASSSSPYSASAKSNAKLQEVRVRTPWGKGCTNNQMHATSLLVEVD